MAYADTANGYGDYGYGYGYGYGGDGFDLDALGELAGPNSSAYERSSSPGAGIETSYAREDAAGTVYVHDTSYTSSGSYTAYSGSFASGGSYYGYAYYGYRYSSFSSANETFGDAAPPLYADRQLDGPGSSAYDRATSPTFGTTTDYASEAADGAHYSQQTQTYGTDQQVLTDTFYSNAADSFDADLKTYARGGIQYEPYGSGIETYTYNSSYNSQERNNGTTTFQTSDYGYARYENGSSDASIYGEESTFADGRLSGSSAFHYSVYTNPEGVSTANGYYGMSG